MKRKLAEFERQIRFKAGNAPGWPFLCDGSPFGCDIFLVGINPATDVKIWPHWSIETGVDKVAWLREYRNELSKFTPTRLRIERLVKAIAPARVLETNIFHQYSKREKYLRNDQRTTDVFDFLIETLKPKLVLVHGKSAIRHIERLVSAQLIRGEFTTVQYKQTKFDIIAHHHLAYQWSYDKIDEVGNALRERWRSQVGVD